MNPLQQHREYPERYEWPDDTRYGAGDRASDFSFITLWMAGSLAGVMTAAFIRQAPIFRKLMRRLGLAGGGRRKQGRGAARKPTPRQALPMLAHAIVGNSKCAVARVFGPPHAAIISQKDSTLTSPTYWHADTWYYPVPRNGQFAIAIRFADDSARLVEFLESPAE